MQISISASIRNDLWTDIQTASKRINLFTFKLWLLVSTKSTCRLFTARKIQGMDIDRQETTR